MVAVALFVDTLCDKVIVEFIHYIVLTLQVYHRTCLTFLIYKEQARDMGILGHLRIVGTKSWCDMHDTGTILCGHIVTWNHTESLTLHFYELILTVLTHKNLLGMGFCVCLHIVGSICIKLGRRLHPRHQLLILQTYELFACIVAYNTIWNELLTFIIFRHFAVICDMTLWCQIGIQTAFCQNDSNLLGIVGIIGLHSDVVNLRTYAEGCV